MFKLFGLRNFLGMFIPWTVRLNATSPKSPSRHLLFIFRIRLHPFLFVRKSGGGPGSCPRPTRHRLLSLIHTRPNTHSHTRAGRRNSGERHSPADAPSSREHTTGRQTPIKLRVRVSMATHCCRRPAAAARGPEPLPGRQTALTSLCAACERRRRSAQRLVVYAAEQDFASDWTDAGTAKILGEKRERERERERESVCVCV